MTLTPLEKVIQGLRNNPDGEGLIINTTKEGRGVFTTRQMQPGDFVIEYVGELLFDRGEIEKREEMYDDNGEGCYVIHTTWGMDCKPCVVDPTRLYTNAAKFINHKINGNIRPHRLVKVNTDEQPRLGMVAARHIAPGTQLYWDYGVRDKDIPWLQEKLVS